MAKYLTQVKMTITRSIFVEADSEEEANENADSYISAGRRFHLTPDIELNHESLSFNGDRWELEEWDIDDTYTSLMDH